MSTTIIVVILALLILVIIPVTAALYRSWKVPRTWSKLQKRRGLEDETSDPEQTESPSRLAGDVRGRDVEVWMDDDIAAGGKTGPPHAHYTNIEAPLRNRDPSRIGIQQKGVGPTIWRTMMTGPGGFEYKEEELTEGTPPEVGNGFDADFDVAGELSGPLERALRSPKIRSLLDDLLSPSSEVHIEEGTLRYTEPGRVSRQERLDQLIDDIVDLARRIDQALGEQ